MAMFKVLKAKSPIDIKKQLDKANGEKLVLVAAKKQKGPMKLVSTTTVPFSELHHKALNWMLTVIVRMLTLLSNWVPTCVLPWRFANRLLALDREGVYLILHTIFLYSKAR